MSLTGSSASVKLQRPLSPHLQIYKPQITSITSILHRVTGAVLMVGTLPLVLWLWSVAYDAELFAAMQAFFKAWYGMIMLIGWTAAFYYHLANGLRHMYWDIGRGFTLKSVDLSGVLAFVFTVLATVVTWVIVLKQGA